MTLPIAALDTSGIQKYADIMKEIKHRKEIIDRFFSGNYNFGYIQPNIEAIGLQFRKIFEHIAFASLAANRVEYAKVYADFAKHWEAAKLLKSLRRINANFYPKPIVEVPSQRPGVAFDIHERTKDYLTQDDLISAHGKCGKIMHAANPFGKPIDYDYYQQTFPSWMQKIMNLLNTHQIHLAGESGFWLLHMEEAQDKEIHWYRFEQATHVFPDV